MTSHLLHPHSAFYLQAALIGAVLTLLQHAVPTLGVSSQFSTAAPVLALLEEDATASLCYLERQPTLLFLPNGTQTSLPQPDTEWITNTTRDTPPPGAARSKRSYSYDRHIEIMVVADPKMAKYHGDNLHHYVLTLMATVSSEVLDFTMRESSVALRAASSFIRSVLPHWDASFASKRTTVSSRLRCISSPASKQLNAHSSSVFRVAAENKAAKKT